MGGTPHSARAARSRPPLLAPATLAALSLLALVAACPAAPPQQVPPTEEVYQPGPEIGERPRGGGRAAPAPALDAGSRLAVGGDAAPGGGSVRLPAGEFCFDGGECESGICEGEGCGTKQPGRCIAAGRACRGPEETFCGCDGEIFRAPRDCPGQVYAKRGTCRAR